jgi:hypothetical protein
MQIDRLGTPDKYALGPELVLGRRLLARGENPLQSISTLFRLRNQLAHPKAGRSAAWSLGSSEPHPVLNPENAMRHIVEVARAANVVITEGGRRYPDQHAGVVVGAAEHYLAFAAKATASLAPPNAEPDDEVDAVFVAGRRVAEVMLPQFRGWRPPRQR